MGLKDALQLLHSTESHFKHKSERQAIQFENVTFPKLTDLVDRMSAVNVARKVFCPVEYLEYWQDFLNKKINDIPARVRRFLCWEPSIGSDVRFLSYIDSRKERLSAHSLQGLVYTRHLNWSADGDQNDEIRILRKIIRNYSGRNRLIKKWQGDIDIVLSPQATSNAANKLLGQMMPIAAFTKEWGINEQTEFSVAIVSKTAAMCLDLFGRTNFDKSLISYFVTNILEWKNADLSDYKHRISATVLLENFKTDEAFQEIVIEHILGDSRLGDPRLPSNSKNWVGVSDEAQNRIRQLLSRADIVFFFDQVMTEYDDRHGRKEFWLRYIPSLKQSRPLLSRNDRSRLQGVLRREANRMMHFGITRGQQSAFMLDFGSILVIEFNGVGACYIYGELNRKKFFKDIYANREFNDDSLKKPSYAEERLIHKGDWQWRFQNVLANYGVRPS